MDRDNPDSDPVATRVTRESDELAKVVGDDIRRSITRESLIVCSGILELVLPLLIFSPLPLVLHTLSLLM